MRRPPSINAGSMADIAFLLLTFFMVTTTMDPEIGLNRKLPPDEEASGQIHDRNVLKVWINNDDDLLVNYEPMDATQLTDYAADFMANANDDPSRPEKELKELPLIGETPVSKQVVSLQCGKRTTYATYVSVQDALARAYRKLRNEFAERTFNSDYETLLDNEDAERLEVIHQAWPMRISEAEPFE